MARRRRRRKSRKATGRKVCVRARKGHVVCGREVSKPRRRRRRKSRK